MLRDVKKNGTFYIGLLLLTVLLLLAFLGPYLPFIDEELQEKQYRYTEDEIPVPPPFEPSENYLIGSDRDGRDMLSLLVVGAKETLFIILMITLTRYLMAIPLSFLAHKKVKGATYVMNWLNGLLSYIPTVIMVVLLATLPPILFADARPIYIIGIIALVEVGRAAEMIKQEFDMLATKEFMKGGIAGGATNWTLLKSYYFPFIYKKLFVYMVFDLGKVMFLLGQLGVIGIFVSQALVQVEVGQFEIRNESVSWPMLLMHSIRDIRNAIWIPFWSAFAMFYTIFTFNVLAQGLQNRFKRNTTYI